MHVFSALISSSRVLRSCADGVFFTLFSGFAYQLLKVYRTDNTKNNDCLSYPEINVYKSELKYSSELAGRRKTNTYGLLSSEEAVKTQQRSSSSAFSTLHRGTPTVRYILTYVAIDAVH